MRGHVPDVIAHCQHSERQRAPPNTGCSRDSHRHQHTILFSCEMLNCWDQPAQTGKEDESQDGSCNVVAHGPSAAPHSVTHNAKWISDKALLSDSLLGKERELSIDSVREVDERRLTI